MRLTINCEPMKLVRWMRFTWDLAKLPAVKGELESHYHIRVATHDDEKSVRSVISSAFSIDMNWSDTVKSLRDHFEAQVDRVFVEKEVPCIVVSHGARVIGASALDTSRKQTTTLYPARVFLVNIATAAWAPRFCASRCNYCVKPGWTRRTASPSPTCRPQNSFIQNSIP